MLAALCLGVVALFFHASYCGGTEVTNHHAEAPASVQAAPTHGHGDHHEAPEQCQHDEHAVLQDVLPVVHAPDSVLLLLGLLALVTPALCPGLGERLRACWAFAPVRPVPVSGRLLLTQLCLSRT